MKYKSLALILVTLLCVSCAVQQADFQAPSNLTCNYRINPIGLDDSRPQFSWHVSDVRENAAQSAYQVMVASDAKLLKSGQADMWDSGKVDSDQSIHIEYSGKPMQSRGVYYWTVQTWDADGQPSGYSKPASFECAFLDQAEWQAEWIGFDAGKAEITDRKGTTYEKPNAVRVRKDFSLKNSVKKARVYVTGLGNYVLSINGERVGKDLLTPGWTDYDTKVQYQVYDVTDVLKKSKNAVGAELGNMWWSSGLGWGESNVYSYGPLRFLMQLEIEYKDGSVEKIMTDESWVGNGSPTGENTLYHGEKYDARKETPGWSTIDFDASAWQPVLKVEQEPVKLVAQQGPTIRKTQTMVPQKITEPQKGVYVFDFAQNMVGWTKLSIKGSADQKIVLKYSELLNKEGTVAQENLRRAMATDEYICKGDGVEEWEPQFTYHGFRYVQVEGLTEKPDENTLTGHVIHSDAPWIGTFACSNDLVNQLHKNITWGQRGNMHSVPTDCPQRDERLGWMGDAQIFAPSANFNMNMAPFFSKWVKDIVDCQDESGYVYDVNPAIVVGGPSKPGWGDAVAVVPWMVYKYYGDTRIIKDNYDGIKAWVEYMRKNAKRNVYVWEENGWYGYGDWIAPVKSPGDPIGSAYYYYSTKLLANMAEIIGNKADAEEYNELADKIAKAFHKKYFDKKEINYPGGTQTANLLPLAFGLVPDEYVAQIAKNVADDVIDRDYHPSTGFLGTGYILPMLSHFGYHDVAYKMFTQTTYPSWGYMVKGGATTMWELWNSDTEPPEGMNSRNHFALGGICEWYYAYLAGLRPTVDEPGFKKIIFEPGPTADLTWAEASVETEYGLATTRWDKSETEFTLKIKVPANTTADVLLPVAGVENSEITQNGEVVSAKKMENGKAKLSVGAGEYTFVVSGK